MRCQRCPSQRASGSVLRLQYRCSRVRSFSGSRLVDFEITYERQVIRETDVRHLEAGHGNSLLVQDEVQLLPRCPAGVRGKVIDICTLQSGCAHEEINFVLSPECIEIASNDHGLLGHRYQIVEFAKLQVPVAVLQRQVHQENRKAFEFELDDQPLYAGVEVVKGLAMDIRRGEKRILLLADDRQELVDRPGAIVDFVGCVEPEIGGDFDGLADATTPDRSCVEFNEPDYVRLGAADEGSNLRQYALVPEDIAGARQRHMHRRSRADGVADVIEKKSHVSFKATTACWLVFLRRTR